MAERSALISRRRRTMSVSFSRKTTFTSFTLTSSEDLCTCRFNIRQGQIYMANPGTSIIREGLPSENSVEPGGSESEERMVFH